MSTGAELTDKAAKAARKAAKLEKKLKKAAKAAAASEDAPEGSSSSVSNKRADEDEDGDVEMTTVTPDEPKETATEQVGDEAAAKAARKALKKEKKRKAKEEAATDDATTTTTSEEPSKKKKKKDQTPAATTAELKIAPSSSSEIDAFLATNKITYEPEDAVTSFPPVLSFAQLPVDAGLKKGLSGFEKPTPIQSVSFPVMMGGRDVVGVAETGSGKTISFGVPAVQHILSLASTQDGSKGAPPAVLVVAPTRELAMQTHDNLTLLCRGLPTIKSICVYGGASKDDQKKSLKKDSPRIVVGTPGRLLDLANEGALRLGQVSWLVLDEADRMLDKGFENDIRNIIGLCLPTATKVLPATGDSKPTQRHTCMFSATWPLSVRKLASDFMHSAIRITVGSEELQANKRVEQSVTVLSDGREKDRLLPQVLRQHGFGVRGKGGKEEGKEREKCLVFALYKKEAVRVENSLQRQGFEVCCIQGDMSQDKRTKALEDFKTGKAQVMVATDVAARGLDIPKVELVINHTFPLTIEDYVHRIGRTGRAGRTGKSVTFFTEDDKAHAGELMRILREGNQAVPENLGQWGTHIKKKEHSAYGAHFRDDIKGTAKKIVFD